MARSFVYNRPLDAKILLDPENPNHEFQFNTLLEIKKEVENDPLEMETEETAPDSSRLKGNHDPELQSSDSPNQYDETSGHPRPKLVLNFRDLRRKSEQSVDYPKKKMKDRKRETIGPLLTVGQLNSNKRCRSEFNVSSEDRVTRSFLSGSRRSDLNRETKNGSDSLQRETASDAEEKQDVWNLGRITRLKKNLNTLCESCGMCFSSDRQLQAHKSYYTADGEYHCTTCDIRFSRRFQLSRHVKIAHSPIGNSDAYKFKCHLCIDRFERKVSLIAHVTHLHNKQVVTHKRNSNKEIITSFPIPYARRKKRKKKKKVSERKSNRVRSRVLAINSNDRGTKVHDNSNSTLDFNEPAGIQLNEGDQLIDNNVGTRSTECPMNTNYSECSETLIAEKHHKATATVSQDLETPIDDLSEKLIRLRNTQERIDTLSLNSRLQLIKKDRASSKLLEPNEERSPIQQKSQTGLNGVPEIVQSRLTGDLVDHLGNKVGNWCVSEPFMQPGSSPLKTIVLNNPATNAMNLATYSDQPLTQSEQLSALQKSLHLERDNYMSRVHLHPNDVDGELKLLPQHQPLEEQVGSVLLDEVSGELKVATKDIKVEVDSDVELECDKFDIDLMQVDDFGETHKSNVVNDEEEEVSDDSYESISLKMTGSSSNASVADSMSLDSHKSVDVLKSRDTQHNIKVLRVCLVKLENMINLSTGSDPPKSSSSENDSLVKSETAYGDPRQKQITNDWGAWQTSKWINNSGEVNLSQGSRSIIVKKRVTTVPFRKALANTNRRGESRKVGRGSAKISEKRCLLCEAVFPNTFDIVSHYVSVHTKPGVLQCCLCYSSFRNLGKLRVHLLKHHRLVKKKLKFCCLLCKKEISMPNLTRRCTACNESFESQQSDSQKEQLPNEQTLPEHRSASEIDASENVSVPLSKIAYGKEKSSVAAIDHESAKNNDKVVSPRIPKKNHKHFNCSTCDSVFSDSSRLKDHLLKAHANDGYESSTNIVKLKPQTLPHSKSPDNENKPKNRRRNKNSAAKLRVEKKRAPQSKNLRGHDELCKKKSSTRQKLRFSQMKNKYEHLVRHHNVRVNVKTCFDHKCDVCGLNCCCRRSLKIHKTRYLTNGNKVCNICGLTFAWKHVLVMHMKRAHNPKVSFCGRVRCEICNQGFYKKKFLRIHLAHFHNIKYFQCKICRIRFDTCRSLNNHRRYYSKSLSRRCRTCGQSFKCKYMLEYHEAQVHNREKLKTYKYSCDVCNFAFADELLLQAHIGHFHNMHDRESETNDVSTTTEQLPENIRLPMKTENYCSDSTVSTNVSITREHANEMHSAQGIAEDVVGKTIRTHTSSEYKCGLCKLSFNNPYAILNHEWEFSNDGAHVCTVCNRKFMTNSLLKDHRIKHYQRNVIRKYECYICKEDFWKLDHLKMHGMHLHGPQFVWDKSFESTDIDDRSTSESQTKRDCDGDLKKISTDDAYGTIGLMASNEGINSGKILLFKKISNNKWSTELQRRHSNEDSHCCCFCKKNFSSEPLLEEHMQKHSYRAYYTNSSRYLCLICKNKFRTNDILRAHVIHCHTSDRKGPNLRKPGCSKDSVPAEPIDSKAHIDDEENSVEKDGNQADNVAANLRSKRGIRNKLSDSEKCNGDQRSSRNPPSKKRRLSNSNGEVNIFQSDRAHRTPVPREVEYKTENELEYNYLSGGNDRNCSEPALVAFSYSGITSRIESDSKPEEVELFTVTVKSTNGLEKYVCTICVATFLSVAQFREHFASVHVKNKEYLCTSCGEIFSVMSDLKDHVLKHEEEPRKYVCCDETFLLTTDFVRHQLSHDSKTEENQNKPYTQSSPLFEAGSPGVFNDETNVNEPGGWCKCEICDKAFPDFETMLKHWDTCIDTNGLQCDLCRATFKTLNSFRMHKMTYHEKEHTSYTVQNRRSFRLKGDRSNQVSIQSSIVHDNKLRRRTIGHSGEGNTMNKSERAAALANKISKQNELLRLGKIMVKPFAKFSKSSKMNPEYQESDVTYATKLRLELRSSSGTQSSKQGGASKTVQKLISADNNEKRDSLEMKGNASIPLSTVSTVHRPTKSIEEVSLEDEQASDIDTCNANKHRLERHLQVKDSNKIGKQHCEATDSSLRLRRREPKEEGPGTSQQDSLTATQISNSLKLAAANSIEIGNSKMDSTESPKKSRSDELEAAKSLNLLPAPLNSAESYYICIQPVANTPGNIINNAGVVTSDSGKNLQPNTTGGKLLSSLVSLPLNPGISPTYFLCVKPTTDNVSKPSTQTVPMIDFKSKSHANSGTPKIPQIIGKPSNVVLNPVHASDIQRIAHNSKTSPNAASNDSIFRLHLNSNKDTTVLTAGTSGGGNLIVSQTTTAMRKNIFTEKSATMKELVLGKQVVRCNFCKLLFAEKTKLVKHMESHKTDNQCPACGLTFSNERGLQQHLPEHRCSACPKCNMITFFSDSVPNPKGSKKYCSVCGTPLPLPTRKLNCLPNVTRQVMKCGICMATFGTTTQMAVHFKMVHSSYICGTCECTFNTYYSLLNHMRAHAIESCEATQCKTCKKYFTNQSDLTVHMLTH